jgi:hypothetical protein
MLFLAALTFLVLGVVPSAGAGGGKMNVCHRTGSQSNPYVGISPSQNAKGHGTHPEKNGNNNKSGSGWQKGPHNSGNCATSSGGGGGGGGGNNGGTPTNGGGPGGSSPFAAPAPAIVGQPSVTG